MNEPDAEWQIHGYPNTAYQAVEQALRDQRLILVSGSQYQAILDILDRPESDNPGLPDLFSRHPVWANP
ncbi:type II toxin-antitoxin system TacA family antitoxin [Castellaniella caeni]|uniref:type II toxin-antitoxin system TacA family antitoxin n=1 Tax=Castellaniella caeni TaxID=266123 RepID=UPI0009FE1D30|nr:DUF1778 domain-containing protein [Castellaniella caeni]